MGINEIIIRLKTGLLAHVLNPFWHDKMTRRAHRNDVLATVIPNYLKRYLSAVANVPDMEIIKNKDEKIYSIWGWRPRPKLVDACFRSVAHNCPQQHIILNENTLFDAIQLPDYIMKKRAAGKIGNAHFADICRVELLYRYGGIWMDATGFVSAPPPSEFTDDDFFCYLINPKSQSGWRYSFMQNCFLGARRGSYLLAAWRAMIWEYWRCENSAMDYMIHQLMFKTVVENDPRAKIAFAKMRHIYQDATHALWWKYQNEPFNQKIFNEITGRVWVQKTTYHGTENPILGSFADVMINKMYK